ncbi:hypothetical protein LC608_34705 [Nostoc sp. XA010]|uniref:hypothetical protein n=1 Tax=Nostoc sp. XA010 TaxID=2780407 RepID=UPI001E528598|nr:hypothetical protein [Nostoc sp. XA010]MCC5661997.1 hypothetical protein [Nostoc sp. XA010]
MLVSPYLLLPRHIHLELATQKLTISDIVGWLIYPSDENTNSYFKSKIGIAYLNYTSFVLSDFMRNYVDKKYPDFKMPRHFSTEVKELVKSEAELLGQLWRTIKLLSTDYFSKPLPLVFFEIFKEFKLCFFIMRKETKNQETKVTTATNFRKAIQAQNRQLNTFDPFENPFDINRSPSTHDFVNICHFELNKNNDFRTQYNALVAARQSLTTKIIASHPEFRRLEGGKKENRGRRY